MYYDPSERDRKWEVRIGGLLKLSSNSRLSTEIISTAELMFLESNYPVKTVAMSCDLFARNREWKIQDPPRNKHAYLISAGTQAETYVTAI